MQKLLTAVFFVVSLGTLSSVAIRAESGANPNDLIIVGNGEFSVKGAIKIDVNIASKMHGNGVTFVDARSANFFKLGHIPGSVSLFVLDELTEENLAKHVEKWQAVVFYCDYPRCYKSAQASAKAITWGYTKVHYFAGGMEAWEKAGHPITKGN